MRVGFCRRQNDLRTIEYYMIIHEVWVEESLNNVLKLVLNEILIVLQ